MPYNHLVNTATLLLRTIFCALEETESPFVYLVLQPH